MTSLCRPTRTFLSALRSLCRFPTKALNCVFVIDQENIRFLTLDTFCWGKVLTLFSELIHENLQEVLETCRENFFFPLKCSVLCWLKILLFDVWSSLFTFGFVLYYIVFFCVLALLWRVSLSSVQSLEILAALRFLNEAGRRRHVSAREGRATLSQDRAVVSHTDCRINDTPTFLFFTH